MLQKILAKLVQLYPGLPQSYLGLIAKQLAAKVTEESQIEGAITELDGQFPIKEGGEEFQKEGDRRVTDAQKAWTAKQQQSQQQQQGQGDNKKDPKEGDETPEWAKSMMAEIAQLKKDKAQGTIRQQIEAKLKDVPKIIWGKWALPESEDQIDTFVQDAVKDYTEFKQEQINKGFMLAEPPEGGEGAGGGGGSANTKAVESAIDNWVKSETKSTATTK